MATDTSLYVGPPSAPDRYRLRRSIGRGGEAVLYLAEIELSGEIEPVVVKVLDTRETMGAEQFARTSAKWNDQAELLRFVHRLGVVGVREHFEGAPPHRRGEGGGAGEGGEESTAGQTLCLVMNHVEGLDLRDWRAERTLEPASERREAIRCLEQVAEVLDWLHSGRATPSGRTVVHGDLSPGNVMVDEDGQATLVDFGLSKLTADHQTAEVWFTPGYAAPEVFSGTRSPAADRYAFGAIAYFLLSGESPPSTPEQLRERFLTLPYLVELPREQTTRLLPLFSAEPGDRPESLTAWIRDLRRTVVSTTTTSQPATAGGTSWPTAAVPPHPPTQPATPYAATQPAGAPPAAPPAPAAAPRRNNKALFSALAVGAVALVLVGALLGSNLGGGGEENSATPQETVTVDAPAGGGPGARRSDAPATPSPSSSTAVSPSATASPSTMPTGSDPTPLTTLESVDELGFEQAPAIVNTKEYADALTATPDCSAASYVAYNLDRAWSTLSFEAGISDTSVPYPVKLTVKVDGDTAASKTLTLGKTVKVNVDVSDGLRLRIEMSIDCTSDDPVAVVGAPALYK